MPAFRSLAATALVAIATTLTPPVAAHATATPPTLVHPCTWVLDDTSTVPGATTFTGTVTAGPVVAPGSTISVRCSIHADNWTHSGPEAWAASSAPTPTVGYLPPTVATFDADRFAWLVTCTSADVDGVTWYLGRVGWSTDPNIECGNGGEGTIELPEPLKTVVDVVLCLVLGLDCDVVPPTVSLVDSVVCPVFVAASPGVPGVVDIHPDGDVYLGGELWYDCPPYAI
jgi:hypothetical protein